MAEKPKSIQANKNLHLETHRLQAESETHREIYKDSQRTHRVNSPKATQASKNSLAWKSLGGFTTEPAPQSGEKGVNGQHLDCEYVNEINFQRAREGMQG